MFSALADRATEENRLNPAIGCSAFLSSSTSPPAGAAGGPPVGPCTHGPTPCVASALRGPLAAGRDDAALWLAPMVCLCLGWRDVPDGLQQPMRVEPPLADRLEPEALSMFINKWLHDFKRPSRSACAKNALASFRISLARRSSLNSRARPLMRSCSLVVVPCHAPASVCAPAGGLRRGAAGPSDRNRTCI